MEAKDYLAILTQEIHSTVFATVDANGYPHTCVIDVMLCDENSLYFLTSKGKVLYDRLGNQHFVSISGMKGADTLSTVVVSVRGKVREVGHELVKRVFEENPYMNAIYPKTQSREILTVFQLYEGEGEFFDLRQQPPFHEAFSFGGAEIAEAGYMINDNCTKCEECLGNCPSNCIENAETHFQIREEYCIHCGTCFATCRFDAVHKK